MTIEVQANRIYELVKGLPNNEALKALHLATGRILQKSRIQAIESWVITPKRTPRSRIEKDPEIKEFLLSQTEPSTIAQLLAEISSRFGEDRTPSKTGLARWFKKMQGR
jgi:hypothetical protein